MGALAILRAFVARFTRLCRTGQNCRKLAQDAGLVALAIADAPSDLSLMIAASIQRVLDHFAWVYLCQIARKCFKRAFSHS